MRCPICGLPVQAFVENAPDTYKCNSCGWTQNSAKPSPRKPTLLKLIGLWVVLLLVVLGPWFFLHYGAPYLVEAKLVKSDFAKGPLAGLFKEHYWPIIMLYVSLAAVLPFGYEPDRVIGLLRYNEYNRIMLTLDVLVFPGRVVLFALENTCNYLRKH